MERSLVELSKLINFIMRTLAKSALYLILTDDLHPMALI